MSDQQNDLQAPRAGDVQPTTTELWAITRGLAHEIRNPLSTLKVNLQLLREDWRDTAPNESAPPDLAPRSVRRLETMIREVDRLSAIVDDFVRFAGRHELQCEPRDVNGFLAELLDFIEPRADAQHVTMSREFAAGLPPVSIDSNLLKQAVLNLLLNAIEAMPDGGSLTTITRLDGEQVVVDVIDDGCGIAAADRDRIFEAYYSTRKGGTGLGLPTAQRIVQEHGGRIDVQPGTESGTRFSVYLPMVHH